MPRHQQRHQQQHHAISSALTLSSSFFLDKIPDQFIGPAPMQKQVTKR
jgi:hypothetical protein